jgi:hypothetical protein
MKALLLAGMGALLATGAIAQTRTQTFDGPKFEGTHTVTRDRDAGTLSRDLEVTRKSDGAVATRSFDRQRTEDGVTASGSATNFKGQTRNWEYQRTRTENGYTASGQGTGFNGQSYTSSGNGERTANGFNRSQTLRNGAGETLYDRQVAVSRANGQVSRQVNVTRAEGFRPNRAGPRRRR